MIISRFNKYVEKHGRVTYIVLGIIICFMFVIFVAPEGSSGGCFSRGMSNKIGKMFGKTIYVDEFLKAREETDLAYMIQSNVQPSQYGDQLWNNLTLARMRQVYKAKKDGYFQKISDEEVAKTILDLPWLKDDKGNFSQKNFDNFKNYTLKRMNLTARDFDDIIRANLAIKQMQDDVTSAAKVEEKEIDDEVAQFQVSWTEVQPDDKAGKPTEDAIKKFFETRKADIPLAQQRRALVASLSIPAAIAAAGKADAPEALKKAATVTDEEAKDYYEGAKEAYKDKKFEEVKASVVNSLRGRKVRSYLREVLDGASQKLAPQLAGKDAAAAEAAFEAAAKEIGATVAKTGLFGEEGDEIPGMAGKHPALVRQVRALDTVGSLTPVVVDGGNFAVAMLAEKKAGELPKELDEATSKKISGVLEDEEAVAWFNKEIAVFKDKAAGSRSVWDLAQDEAEKIQSDVTKSDQQKQEELSAYSEFIREYVSQFYRPEQRAFTAVAFSPSAFEAEVEVTEEDYKKAFEARKSQYDKTKVKLAQILVKDGEGAEKKLADVQAKIQAGTEFAAVAKELSDDEATKAKGGEGALVDVTTLEQALQDAVAKMEVNQISAPVKTAQGTVLCKLVEKENPRTLDDVRSELEPVLRRQAARTAAMEAASALSRKVKIAWGNAGHQVPSTAALLRENAAGTKGIATDYALTSQDNYAGEGATQEPSVMSAVFGATEAEPFTDAVNGNEAAYVAVMTSRQPAYMEEAKDVMPGVRSAYRRHFTTEAARKTAEAEVARINTALKAGDDLAKAAGERKFKDVEKPISVSNLNEMSDFAVRNRQALLATLGKAEPKSVIAPQQTYTGFALVYLASRTIPTGDEAKKERDQVRERLLQEKKNELFSNFMKKLEEDSATEVAPSILGK
ncbi:MAG: peptidyl-prolyl cis-trans isomerase [Victivallales bacterium]|nr:peptidyl-prolyl cis-trans isomerase [Victivallales bacterium]